MWGFPLAWSLPTGLAALEWFAARVPGLPYAWLNAGGSLAWYPPLAGLAPLLGSTGLSFWTTLTGAAAGAHLASRRWRSRASAGTPGPLMRPVGWGTLAVVAAGLVPGMGYIWGAGPDPGDGVGVVAVQPGRVEAGRERGGIWGMEGWTESVAALAQRGDVVVFPEAFVRGAQPEDVGRRMAERLGQPVLYGVVGAAATGGSGASSRGGNATPEDTPQVSTRPAGAYNGALLVVPGEAPQLGLKHRLVPGLEGGAGRVARWLGVDRSAYATASAPSLLRLDGIDVGLLICYDSAFGPVAGDLVREGADVLIVLSNDDWLDPNKPPRATWAYWQHRTQGILRSLEHQVPLVQVATTGTTFAANSRGLTVTPSAQVVRLAGHPDWSERSGTPADLVPVHVQAVSRFPMALGAGGSWFTRTGDMLGLTCFLIVLVALLPVGLVRGVTRVPRRS